MPNPLRVVRRLDRCERGRSHTTGLFFYFFSPLRVAVKAILRYQIPFRLAVWTALDADLSFRRNLTPKAQGPPPPPRFENQMSRDLHFEKPGHEFGAADAAAGLRLRVFVRTRIPSAL